LQRDSLAQRKSKGKASDKPRGGPELSGEEGRLLLLPERWRRVISLIPFPEFGKRTQKTCPEKVASLMIREHLINLAEVVTKR
jgi:hypothetical protein